MADADKTKDTTILDTAVLKHDDAERPGSSGVKSDQAGSTTSSSGAKPAATSPGSPKVEGLIHKVGVETPRPNRPLTTAPSFEQYAAFRSHLLNGSVMGHTDDSELSQYDTAHSHTVESVRPSDTWIPLSSQLAGWAPDKGDGRYSHIRERVHMPALIENGLKGGESRLKMAHYWGIVWFQFTRDFFISALNVPLHTMLPVLSVFYLLTFFFFSGVWSAVNAIDKDCLSGITDYASIWVFAMVTTQTIGYGNSSPNNCSKAAIVLFFQSLLSLFMNSVVVGIVFARVAFPQHRGRTIAISNSAIIIRRDGILKFMFRLMDMRETQVVSPTIKAVLYTWGDGRSTAEGEHIPVRVEELSIGYIDGMMLLPLTIEHTIDERSPLVGYTHDMLLEMRAEVVVTFEGTTEFGNPFMARQSYTALEIHWGSKFKQIIYPPPPGETRYTVDIKRFHDVEPLEGLPKLLRGPLSEYIVASAIRTVPYPLLAENTLVLSDSMVFSRDENGDLALMFRLGDTYPLQHMNVTVKAAIYRWPNKRSGKVTKGIPRMDFAMDFLDVGYETGEDRLLLWLPTMVKHVISDDSPLRAWRTKGGFEADAMSTIAVEVEGYMYCNSQSRMRMRLYNVKGDVMKDHRFANIIHHVKEQVGTRPAVDWRRFHDTEPIDSLSDRAKEAMPEYLQKDAHRLQQSQWRLIAKRAVDKGRRRIAPPELGAIALFPENDETNTFRLRSAAVRVRPSELGPVGTPSVVPDLERQDTLEIRSLP